MGNNNSNNITLDDLAVMMKKGFDGVDNRLTGITQTLDRVVTIAVNTQEDVKGMKTDVKYCKENIDVLLTNQDWMIGVLTRIDQERIMGSRSIQQIRDDMEKLAKRVERLELAHA